MGIFLSFFLRDFITFIIPPIISKFRSYDKFSLFSLKSFCPFIKFIKVFRFHTVYAISNIIYQPISQFVFNSYCFHLL